MQHHGAAAYQQTAKTIESPREREAALLLKGAAMLQGIKDSWPESRDRLDGALTFNRKLWTVFVGSVTDEGNPLPTSLRQNIANLGVFVLGQTYEMMLNPTPARLDGLININRQLAAGLRGN